MIAAPDALVLAVCGVALALLDGMTPWRLTNDVVRLAAFACVVLAVLLAAGVWA